MTEDLEVAANPAVATDVRVDEVKGRVDTLEVVTEALTDQAIVASARVDRIVTRTEALADDRIIAADRQTALRTDSAPRLVAMETRLDVAANKQTALVEKQAAVKARLEKVEQLAEAIGVFVDAPSVAHDFEPLPPKNH